MSQQQFTHESVGTVLDIWSYWAQYSRDQLELLELVYDYQEKAQQWRKYEPDGEYHGALDQALQQQLRWSPEKFASVRDHLLETLDPVLIRTHSGRLAVTW